MKTFWQAFVFLILMTVLTGFIYPLVVSGVGQFVFHDKSNGSLIQSSQGVRGSYLLAQQFSSPRYFWARPSAGDFNANPSAASNLGPTSKTLQDKIHERRHALAVAHHAEESAIPQDLLTTSASGLDPHISPEAALFQVNRIAAARAWDADHVARMVEAIQRIDEHRQLWIFGEARVNVLLLNEALDRL